MAMTKQGGKTLRVNMIKKYGSVAAYKEHMASIGQKGGSVGHPETRFFHTNREIARTAGAKGGRISRRPKKSV